MKCSYCGIETDNGDFTNKEDKRTYRCKNCLELFYQTYPICCFCGKRHHISCTVEYNEERCCITCMDKYLFYCGDCEKFYKKEDKYNYSDCCKYCINENIHNFNYKPEPIFHKIGNEKEIYIGIELERNKSSEYHRVDCVDEIINNTNNFVYCKRDASIRRGIEVVSHPATFQYHLQKGHWQNIFNILEDYGFDSIEDAGLHFHINRNILTDNAIKVIDYFLNEKEEYVSKIAGREYSFSDYCCTQHKNINDWGIKTFDRYVAFNLENINTVEIRVCASTDSFITFVDRLSFIYKLVNFALNTDFNDIINNNNIIKMFKEYDI